MAKTPVRTRKRVKKQVADGMAHILSLIHI